MTFILSCLFYSFIGSLTGFFVHIFKGVIQTKIIFNAVYIKKTIINFVKVLVIMILATLATGLVILTIPPSVYDVIGGDMDFFHQLLFYLFAFAAFDFGLKN